MPSLMGLAGSRVRIPTVPLPLRWAKEAAKEVGKADPSATNEHPRKAKPALRGGPFVAS
jgi:hypothetical protein